MNDVRIARTCSTVARRPQLVQWIPEEDCYDRFYFGTKWRSLTADAFLRYRVGNQLLSAFIEDRGTMPNRRFQEKVERYFAYDVSGRYNERYKGQRFRVLVVANSPARLANLKQTTAQVAQRYCWFTTLQATREKGPLASIWEIVGREGKSPLL